MRLSGVLFRSLVLPVTLLRRFRSLQREQHPYHTSVRLTRTELEKLKSLAFELTLKLQRQATVNDIARIALQLLVDDYDLRKKESVLVQVFNEKNED